MTRPCGRSGGRAGVVLVLVLLSGGAAPGQRGAVAPSAAPHAIVERGLLGEVLVEHAGPTLRAKPDQSLAAPMVVRVTELLAAPPVPPAAARRYRVEFIGSVAGDYDLRDWIQVAESGESGAATGLAPLAVRVVSELPLGQGSDLYRSERSAPALRSHYRAALVALAAAWLAVPVVVVVRRALRPRPAPPVPPAPPPTLADVLRPLVASAMSRELSVAEQARLELLLLGFWRDRLGLAGVAPAQAIAQIRADRSAGALLNAVERWLHAAGPVAPRPGEDLATLLAPYRDLPAGTATPVGSAAP